ncbi:beta-galactosidase [Propioniciclava soli]|uniref:beta-galactosidase n=1 Tax=Propioniciclava soli TaxID=2775081 RepID=UPI001E3C32B1|nr:beta-galactosidase [Propioniciclava soli]
MTVRGWNDLVDGLAYGGDYNPEQWPREVWDDDVRLMREAGVNLVSLAIFSWATIEPLEGQFDWAWLDEVIEKLDAGGVRIALATATASPPPWLTATHPEILPVTREGVVLHQGGRQSYRISSPVYREYATAMTRRMAERYGSHPALALWHVDNEIGCHIPDDFSPDATEAFRGWLQRRYGTLEALNEAWGTAFWSQRYGSFEHVLPPLPAPTFPNPTQQLDWRRYTSDVHKEYYLALRAVLREVTPEVPITTNFMIGTGNRHADYADWAPETDVVANDHYTRSHDPERHVELAFAADLTRGVAAGDPWLLMEHSTSAVNWHPRNRAKDPGEMVRNSLSHVARGADGVMFFQWRQSRAGAEKFHSGMVPHAGTDSGVWRSTVELGEHLQRLAPVRGSRVASSVAVVFDYTNLWAVELDSHPTNDLSYPDLVLDWHRAFFHEGVQVDVVAPQADLSGYDLVVAPNLYLADDERVANLTGVVDRGGVFVATWFSGIVDAHDHIHLGGHPGAFAELLGIRTEEFCPLQQGERVGVLLDGVDAEGVRWTERTELRGASAHATYTDGVLVGLPAVTDHAVGDGHAWYVGTDLPGEGKRALVRTWLAQAGIEPVLADPQPGVEAVRRRGEGGSFLFVFNHTRGEVRVPATGTELLTGARVSGALTLPGGGSAVVHEDA